jgi:hypothetical protein
MISVSAASAVVEEVSAGSFALRQPAFGLSRSAPAFSFVWPLVSSMVR